MCHIDYRDVGTQSTSESTHSVCVCFLFSPEDNAIFICVPFSKRGIWFFNMPLSLEVPSIPTVSGLFFLFFFSNTQSCCEVPLRTWKVLFKLEVFAVFTFQLARWISVGQSIERKSFWQDFWRPRSSSCLSFCSFPVTGFLVWLLKRHPIKCKLRSHSLSRSVGPLWRCCSA